MRLNANASCLSRCVTVFLDGAKEPDAVEVYIPGNVLEGAGYVYRAVTKNGRVVAAKTVEKPLPGQYEADGVLCEKAEGNVRIEIEECKSAFETE